MNFLKRIAVLFFVTLNMFLASIIALYVANITQIEDTFMLLNFIYTDETSRIIFAGLAGFILLINYVFYVLFTVNVHRDKTIAFDNPGGRVAVSLSALEDLVKRALQAVEGVKDTKSIISASKKGIHVRLRLSIKSDVNIPELTSNVQEMIKDRIHDTIGIDEKVDINVYVKKIIAESTYAMKKSSVPKSKDTKESDQQDRSVPFHGYGG